MKKHDMRWTLVFLIIRTIPCPAQRIQPADLEYRGAFRLPDSPGMPDNVNWTWNSWASALAFYPDGDPDGPKDGYPGSLFGVGHDHTQYVSEIAIPIPVISPGKDVNELNTAETLQAFSDIRGGLFENLEMPRVGLAYLPPQGDQTTGKLYFAWAQDLDEGASHASHGWCELDLSDPQTTGTWRIGEYWNYVTGDYLFAIPSEWADANTPGMILATGRFRDGGQGTMGPSMIVCSPWNSGNPPAAGSTIAATSLLFYGNVYEDEPSTMNDYHHSDEWSGGTWLTAGEHSAVLFVGTKGQGDCWYGCADGTDEPPWPDDCNRGWWSDSFVGQLLFYDPADLAAVAQGKMELWESQPYATLNIDDLLYHVASIQQWYHLGAVDYDRDSGLLYVMEPRADEDKSIVHVWKVHEGSTGIEDMENTKPYEFRLHQNHPNPFNPETTIAYTLSETAEVVLTILDIRGREVKRLDQQIHSAGRHSVEWHGKDALDRRVASGIYFCRIEIKSMKGGHLSYLETKKMIFIE